MQQRSTRYTRWLVTAMGGALLLSNAACDDKDFNTIAIIANSITVSAASQGQVGVAGQPLAQPIVVHVSSPNGASVVNAVVSWTVLTGGGAVSAPTSLTDANGNASVTWTLGPAAGANSLRASIVSGASVTITATATAAPPVALSLVSGNNQSVATGGASAPMVVQVLDQNGNPVAGAIVTWATTAGTLAATTSTTDANGQAAMVLTSVAAGAATVTANSAGAAAPVAFTITGT